MILILSENSDNTTFSVIKWLEHYQQEVMLITENDKILGLSLTNGQSMIRFSDKELDLRKVTAYWYRRGGFSFSAGANYADCPPALTAVVNQEMRLAAGLIHSRLSEVPHLGAVHDGNINRLVVMDAAVVAGLQVPAFAVFCQREDVAAFAATHGKIVTKPIGDGIMEEEDQAMYAHYTTLFEPEDIAALPETFIPAMFAAYVPKKYELRIFYLDGSCYAMAVISQQDTKTTVDMRRYNYRKPNRNLPYKLPVVVAEKINMLMEKLQLKTGAIDMIVTPEDEFVFLEVNPVGQFGNVSSNCNYQLEQRVAAYLTRLNIT